MRLSDYGSLGRRIVPLMGFGSFGAWTDYSDDQLVQAVVWARPGLSSFNATLIVKAARTGNVQAVGIVSDAADRFFTAAAPGPQEQAPEQGDTAAFLAAIAGYSDWQLTLAVQQYLYGGSSVLLGSAAVIVSRAKSGSAQDQKSVLDSLRQAIADGMFEPGGEEPIDDGTIPGTTTTPPPGPTADPRKQEVCLPGLPCVSCEEIPAFVPEPFRSQIVAKCGELLGKIPGQNGSGPGGQDGDGGGAASEGLPWWAYALAAVAAAKVFRII